jgi:hypothetical protein
LITGNSLNSSDSVSVSFECDRLGISRLLPLNGIPTATQAGTHMPSIAEDGTGINTWGIGVYTVALQVSQPNQPTWTTNGVPLALSPQITVSPQTATAGTVALDITCTPRLQDIQTAQARLLFGSSEIVPASITNPADPSKPTTLHFSIPNVVAGSYLIRLRVDGIDSLPVVLTGSPAAFVFDPQQMVTVT